MQLKSAELSKTCSGGFGQIDRDLPNSLVIISLSERDRPNRLVIIGLSERDLPNSLVMLSLSERDLPNI